MLTLPRAIIYGLVVAALSGTTVHPESVTIEPYPFHRLVTSGGIKLYQKLVSPARGSSCPMHPRCSEYSRLAFQNRKLLRAYLMTADRLLRCGHDLDQYSPTAVNGYLRYSDPADDKSSGGTHSSPSASGRRWPRLTKHDDIPTRYANVDSPGPGQEIFRFAQQLAIESDYYRAITEFRRYLMYFPESPYRSHAQLAVLNCYYGAGLYSEAIEYGEKALRRNEDTAGSDQMMFLVGKSGFQSGDYSKAQEYFSRIAPGAGSMKDKAIMALGLTYAHQSDWEMGAETFASVDESSAFGTKARYCERLSREGSDLAYKNRYLAGVLAIVPGLGYLYDGYYQTAMSALVVNGLFMWGTYEAFDQDHPGLGVTLAVFGIGWYAGNIYGSITSATRKNEKMRQDLLWGFEIGYEFWIERLDRNNDFGLREQGEVLCEV